MDQDLRGQELWSGFQDVEKNTIVRLAEETTVLISSKIPHTLARVPSAILAAAFRSAVRGGEGVFWG